MRRRPRWLLVGAALIATAASGAHAKVRPIDLDACSASCLSPTINRPAEAEDDSAANITLSLFGGGATGADDPSPDLILDPKTTPTVLVSGLPSALASADLQTHGARGPSPYDFFEDVISLPLGVGAKFAEASFFLFAPSLIGRLTLTDILSNSHALFGPPPRPAM